MAAGTRLIVISLVVLVSASPAVLPQEEQDPLVLRGPYLGQSPPGLRPEVFLPGIISSPDRRELGGGVFSPDGKEFYFTRDSGGRWRIMVSRLDSDTWTIPEPFGTSDGFTALEPHITFDNRRIFWVSRGRKDTASGMYSAERTPDGWSEAAYVGPGMMVSSSRDGTMYVTDLDSSQVVTVQIENGRFVRYSRLKGEIARFQRENRTAHPCVAPDGSFMVFDNNGRHLYVTFRGANDEWGKPVDLAEHGFRPEAGIATISPDGNYLFFGDRDDMYWVSTRAIEELKPAH